MTVVLGVSSLVDGFVVADCRLTYPLPGGGRRVHDHCQKLAVANEWSVVGFAGNLCLGRYLLMGVLGWLRETDITNPGWLRDLRQARSYLLQGIPLHPDVFPGHGQCTQERAAILIAWMDYSRMSAGGDWRDGPPAPEAKITTLDWDGHQVRANTIVKRAAVIGRSRALAQELYTEEFEDLSLFFRSYDGPSDLLDAQRALLATNALDRRLDETGRTEGVGGLYQVITLGPRGVQTVPYFQLVDVEPGFRTYVAMRIENGEWVQEHRPSGIQMRVKSPLEIDPLTVPRLDHEFDVRKRLHRRSPGVIPAAAVETVFSLYNPPEAPEAVRRSWGDAQIAPLTYGQSWEQGHSPRWGQTES